MKIKADYHSHTTYSHGKGTILENVKAAKDMGLLEIAITDHGFSHFAYNLKRKKILSYIADCKAAEKETGVKVLVGIEEDILNSRGKIGINKEEEKLFDIVIAGVHSGARLSLGLYLRIAFGKFFRLSKKPKWFIKQNTQIVINALKSNNIDILVHPGKILPIDIIEVAKACRDTNTHFEINERSGKLSRETILKIIDTGVKMVVDSDAHYPENVAQLPNSSPKLEGLTKHIVNVNGIIERKNHKG